MPSYAASASRESENVASLLTTLALRMRAQQPRTWYEQIASELGKKFAARGPQNQGECEVFTIKSSLSVERLEELRPTQITVGMKEVDKKRKEYAALKPKQRQALMCEQLFPVVKGLKGKYFILDHHHAALAMLQEGAKSIQAGLVQDLSHLAESAFWTYLDHLSWMHVYDQRGRKRGFREIPRRLQDLIDDPYRSFAGAIREAGGFSKPPEPFQEFLWANYFREHLALKSLKRDWDEAIDKGLELARSKDAKHIPGWCGPK